MHTTAPRIHRLDELRGFCVLMMVIYHFAFNLTAAGVLPQSLIGAQWVQLLRVIFAGIFVLIAGICCLFSRHNLKRGVCCYLAGVLAEWVTSFLPGMEIRFGILHMLGSAMVLFALSEPLLSKIPPKIGLGISILLAALSWQFPAGILPDIFYSGGLYALGLPGPGFFSADYYPLLPWGMVFLCGYFFGKAARPRPDRLLFPLFSWIGRKSLLIYLLHQPLLFLVSAAAFRLR